MEQVQVFARNILSFDHSGQSLGINDGTGMADVALFNGLQTRINVFF